MKWISRKPPKLEAQVRFLMGPPLYQILTPILADITKNSDIQPLATDSSYSVINR